jgi:hypothetical protein
MHNTGYDKMFFITQFTRGLKPEITAMVQSQLPQSMETVVRIAKVQEQLANKGKGKYQKQQYPPRSYSNNTARNDPKPMTLMPSRLSKERQKRDYCKANNLCFYFSEPFDATHLPKCTKRPKAHVNALVVNDLDVNLTDEVFEQLRVEVQLSAEFCYLSLNAIAGTSEGEAMVKNKVMLILVDSGSSHTFVSPSFVQKCGITPTAMSSKQVQLANGDLLVTDKEVHQLQWWIQGHTFQTDMKVLDLGAYDAILGYDWLKQHSPMSCHWEHKTMCFVVNGRDIVLQGVQPAQLSLEQLPAQQLVKWVAGNDIGAFAVVEVMAPNPDLVFPVEIQHLLEEYADVFEDPRTLPPSRFHDHHIPLLPNVVPVNSKPYRYSPLHKDEIENQVKALLAAGLIVRSTSPFASPVLLVQKKDGTWRFCVDYRKLNSIILSKTDFLCP